MQLTEEQVSVLEGLATCSSAYEQDVLRSILAAHNAGAQEPVAIHDGWVLVKRERIEEIRQYARTEFVNSYLGRNLYDEGSLMKNERIGEEALSNIRDVLSWIEEDEKDRIADHPQPMPQTNAAWEPVAWMRSYRQFGDTQSAAPDPGYMVTSFHQNAEFAAKYPDENTPLYAHPQPQTDASRHLSNILARIHRDGGHYETQHGTEKATADAEMKVAQLNEMTASARDVKRWREKIIQAMRAPSRGDFTIAINAIVREMTAEIERLDRAKGE